MAAREQIVKPACRLLLSTDEREADIESPLWVGSRHRGMLPPQADAGQHDRAGRFVPNAATNGHARA